MDDRREELPSHLWVERPSDAGPSDPGLSDPGRRAFISASVASGFALAVQPVSAETIITDTSGINAGMIDITTKDGKFPAYRAKPQAGSALPVVLVVQEIFGVHEHIKDVCRRLAKLGYYAVAPELYFRAGDPSKLPDVASIVQQILPKIPDAQVMSDLDSTVAFAKAEGADTAKLAITGFCWGGRVVWLYAAHNSALKAGVAWYGRIMGASNEVTPKTPLDLAGEMKAPVLGLYGAADAGIPVEDVKKMEAALKAAGKKAEFVIYPDTPHGFHADYRPSYREAAAKDGWERLKAWFKTNGV